MGVAALREVSRRFGGRIAVHGVSIAVAAREIVGIIGPNGAGKTTLLRMLAGVLRPSAGTIELPPAHAIAYFAGERTLPSEVSAARWLSVCAPTAAVTTTRRFGVLSRGTRQRIGLEGAIANTDATLIVLDEPWEGLDIDASRWLSDRLCERRATGACVVVSSHRIHELAAVCDRCLFITAGRTLGSVAPAADLPHDARVSMLVTAFDKLRDHWRDRSASNAEAIL